MLRFSNEAIRDVRVRVNYKIEVWRCVLIVECMHKIVMLLQKKEAEVIVFIIIIHRREYKMYQKHIFHKLNSC